MTSLETNFVDGLFWRTLIVGAVFAALGWWLMSAHFAGSILLGTMVSAFNLRVVGWVSRKMLQAGAEGRTSGAVWSVLLVLKLFLLFALTFVFIVIVGANVYGYVIGYSTFLLAIVWKLIPQLLSEQSANAEGDTESL